MREGWIVLQMLAVMGSAVMTVHSRMLGARLLWCIALILNTIGLTGRVVT